MDSFQVKLWRERSSLSGIRSTIDPADTKGIKNSYIDLTHKICLDRVMDLSTESKLLDFGCGSGRFSTWIANYGASEVIGLDASLEMVDQANKRCPTRWNLSFLNYDGSTIPFPYGYFDKVLSVWVLQHIVGQGEFRTIVQELNRVLRIGGRIFFIEHVMKETTLEKYPGTNLYYKILRSPEDYINSFQQNGFRLVKYYPISTRQSGLIYKFIERNLFPTFMKKLLPAFVKYDLFTTSNMKVPKRGYVDCLFVFEKVAK